MFCRFVHICAQERNVSNIVSVEVQYSATEISDSTKSCLVLFETCNGTIKYCVTVVTKIL